MATYVISFDLDSATDQERAKFYEKLRASGFSNRHANGPLPSTTWIGAPLEQKRETLGLIVMAQARSAGLTLTRLVIARDDTVYYAPR